MKINRKKEIALLTLTVLIGLFGSGIYSNAHSNIKSSADPPVNVVATTQLLRDFAQQVIGDKGTVSVIVQSGTCPGHYDASASDINLVADADIVFYHGFEWSQFLEQLLGDAENKGARYQINGSGPWGAPANAPSYVDEICDKLNSTYPSLNETFNQNSASYKDEIAAKKAEIEGLNANTYNFTGTKAAIMGYQTGFMSWLGFDITYQWWKDDNTMTPSDIQYLNDNATATETEIIVMNLPSGTEVGKEVADSMGIDSVAILNFPGVYGVNTYLGQLDINVALLHWKLNGGPDPRPTNDGIGINLIIPISASIIACIALIIFRKREVLFK